MLDGKADVVGVAGRTLTEVWGERETLLMFVEVEAVMEFEEVEEALEWVWTWWILRMEEIEEEVDLRPRSPVEGRR